ncbi:MAG: hypothetical protein B6I31_00635 [Desulfobacteraceae bacterium 4572_19]|nr:MAG: hypothetical protein B6I31_00635 [Desulfobacteraceae bacterium 4572_19]
MKMINWHVQAWDDYIYWQKNKPEPLKFEWNGFWSRRINDKHRLVYTIQNEHLIIAQCRYHYDK